MEWALGNKGCNSCLNQFKYTSKWFDMFHWMNFDFVYGKSELCELKDHLMSRVYRKVAGRLPWAWCKKM